MVVALYLIAQMVGAGKLIQLLFGLNYHVAVIWSASLMVLYVLFGGMLATTGANYQGGAAAGRRQLYGADGDEIGQLRLQYPVRRSGEGASERHRHHEPRRRSPIRFPRCRSAALMFGTAGLPHILMRFFTVSDAKEARKSVFYATGFIGYFYILTFIIGFGAILLVSANPAFKDATGALLGGTNMAAVHGQCRWRQLLPRLYLGGGLRHHSGGRCRPDAGRRIGRFHDLYASVMKTARRPERDELKVSKITVVVLGFGRYRAGDFVREAEHRLYGRFGVLYRRQL